MYIKDMLGNEIIGTCLRAFVPEDMQDVAAWIIEDAMNEFMNPGDGLEDARESIHISANYWRNQYKRLEYLGMISTVPESLPYKYVVAQGLRPAA